MSEVYPETPLGSPLQQPQPVVRVTSGPACGCPQQDGSIYHRLGTCADPVVARLGWYGTPPAPYAWPSGTGVNAANEAAVAPELAAAMAETRAVRDGYADLCERFGPGAQSGMHARITLTQLNRHRETAGLPPLAHRETQAKPDMWDRQQAEIDGLRALVAGILQSMPDTADEQEWRDRAGALGVTDPDGQPYRAWTEDDL